MVEQWENGVDEALRLLCADVPEMNEVALAAGRARLRTAIGEAPVAVPAAAEAAVVIAFPAQFRHRSPPRRRAASWLTAAVATVAAVAAVAAGAVVLMSHGSTSARTNPAATGSLPPMPAGPLNDAGDLAARVSEPRLTAGQVWYIRETRTVAASGSRAGASDVLEVWVQDRSKGWEVRGHDSLKGVSVGAFADISGSKCSLDEVRAICPDPGAWSPIPDNVAALPRDPAALYEKLRAKGSVQDATNKLLGLLNDALVVPADLRVTLLRTLGYLPGITITSDARTTDGRPAIAIGWDLDGGNYRNELLLDPTTSRTVEWRNVALKAFAGHQPGQTFSSSIRVEAVVHAVGEAPPR